MIHLEKKKRGRPFKETTKDYMLRVRMDQETLKKLDECCSEKNISRSEIVRIGINNLYKELNNA